MTRVPRKARYRGAPGPRAGRGPGFEGGKGDGHGAKCTSHVQPTPVFSFFEEAKFVVQLEGEESGVPNRGKAEGNGGKGGKDAESVNMGTVSQYGNPAIFNMPLPLPSPVPPPIVPPRPYVGLPQGGGQEDGVLDRHRRVLLRVVQEGGRENGRGGGGGRGRGRADLRLDRVVLGEGGRGGVQQVFLGGRKKGEKRGKGVGRPYIYEIY